MKLSAKKIINTTIALPSSKSESNRVLLIDALYHQQTGKKLDLHNLSTARDTVTMQRLLASKDLELNVNQMHLESLPNYSVFPANIMTISPFTSFLAKCV
jgi:5-enolpyruvylshikimate-3-phosphate synthase